MTPRRAIIVLVLIIAAWGAFAFGQTMRMPDFQVYHIAAIRAASAEPLYQTTDQHYQYKYLPAFAVLTIPLGYLPPATARGLWLIVSLALIVLFIAMSIKLLPEKRRPNTFLTVCAIVVMGKFFVRELTLGQANLLFATVAVWGLLALKRKREVLGGGLTAATVATKPYGIILMPWLIARRQLRSAVAALLGLFAIVLLPAIVYGFAGNIVLHQAWWETVTSTTAPNLLNPDNVSVSALYARWLGPNPVATAMAVLTLCGLVGLAAWVYLKRRGVTFPEGLEGALLLILTPLISPQGWDFVLLVGTPAIIYLANDFDRLSTPWRIVAGAAALTMGLSLFDLLGRAAYGAFMNAGVVTICAIVLIVSLSTLRFRKLA